MGKRSTKVIASLGLAILFWISLLLGLGPLSSLQQLLPSSLVTFVSSNNAPIVVCKILRHDNLNFHQLPLVAIFLFGVYAAITIVLRVATFPSCPDAYEELQKQIIDSKKFYASKGLNLDDKKQK